ncbi:hypothetical protein BDK61_3479 [Haloarcula quadrata]|uniref:Uncharacterized protein n=1 Tax=Haloarcula quadrata TaxID=182779 RepID=A0A495R9Z7_9EURY|nr:hypothetical protein [Haloarcula quadrata]RKS84079.1 hypothetical protein BDK61_3479 [Haloarcula quadrata]
MDQPKWSKLLNIFLQNNGWMYNEYLEDVSYERLPDDHNIINYQIHSNEDAAALNMLLRSGLVESVDAGDVGARPATSLEGVVWYKLTEKGFNVAHERQIAIENQETNESVALFTLVLGFTAIVQAIAAALQLDNITNQAALLTVILLITLLLLLYQSSPLKAVQNAYKAFRR